MPIFTKEYLKTMSGRHRVTDMWKMSCDYEDRDESAVSTGQGTPRVSHHKMLEEVRKDSPLEGLEETWS